MLIRMNRRSLVLSAVAAVAAPRVRAETAREKITFLTDYGYFGRHSYIFYALKKGYFKDEGFDVEVLRGQGSYDVSKQLAHGVAQYGIVDTSAIILARGNDHIPIKAIAMIYAKFPSAVFVLDSSGIKKPKDLEGRTLAAPPGGSGRALFNVFAKYAGFDASKVEWVDAPLTALPAALVSGRVDGISNYVISQPLLSTMAATKNKKVRYLAFSDYGVDAYAQALTTSENLISTNFDQVKRVARATIRGLKGAIAHPEEAAEIIHGYHREIEVSIAEGEIKIVGELATLPGSKIGTIQSGRMEKTIELVKQTTTLRSTVKPEDVYDQVL